MNQAHDQMTHDTELKRSLIKRVGLSGLLKLSFGALICLANVFFYTILPLASLGLLPFIFFGCVLLMTGIADDVGYYR